MQTSVSRQSHFYNNDSILLYIIRSTQNTLASLTFGFLVKNFDLRHHAIRKFSFTPHNTSPHSVDVMYIPRSSGSGDWYARSQREILQREAHEWYLSPWYQYLSTLQRSFFNLAPAHTTKKTVTSGLDGPDPLQGRIQHANQTHLESWAASFASWLWGLSTTLIPNDSYFCFPIYQHNRAVSTLRPTFEIIASSDAVRDLPW
jgi:hypothetical protein